MQYPFLVPNLNLGMPMHLFIDLSFPSFTWERTASEALLHE